MFLCILLELPFPLTFASTIHVCVSHLLLCSTAAAPALSSVEREYRQEGELEREQEERTEVEEGGRGEEGEEERTRVAEGEDTFTESSAGLNRGRETSIMRANGRFGGGTWRGQIFGEFI